MYPFKAEVTSWWRNAFLNNTGVETTLTEQFCFIIFLVPFLHPAPLFRLFLSLLIAHPLHFITLLLFDASLSSSFD